MLKLIEWRKHITWIRFPLTTIVDIFKLGLLLKEPCI